MARFINLPLFSLARMGHSLVTCDGSTFFMFGGYSLGHAALNDLWKFDVETETWTQLLPATNDEPGPRYGFFVLSLKIRNKKNQYLLPLVSVSKLINFITKCSNVEIKVNCFTLDIIMQLYVFQPFVACLFMAE